MALVVLVVASCLVPPALCVLDADLLGAVYKMIGPNDVVAHHLLEKIIAGCDYVKEDLTMASFNSFIRKVYDHKIYDGVVIKAFASDVEYLSIAPDLKADNLGSFFVMDGNRAYGYASVMMSYRVGDTVKYRAALSHAYADLKIPSLVNVNGEIIKRGFYQNEIDIIAKKLERESTIAIKSKMAGTLRGEAPSWVGISATYLDENAKVKGMFQGARYDYSEIKNVEKAKLAQVIDSSTKRKISDSVTKQKIVQIASSAQKSSFLVVPSNELIFLVRVQVVSNSYLLKVSTIQVKGKKLPVGAFATSVGSWKFEKTGEGATPSVNQIIALFPALE